MFKTIHSRYPGTCKRCRQAFAAGTRIRFGGYGRTYHLKADCPAVDPSELAAPVERSYADFPEPRAAVPEPESLQFSDVDIEF
jgi:hypothetical protein